MNVTKAEVIRYSENWEREHERGMFSVFVFTDKKGEYFRPLCKKRDNLFPTLDEVHSFIEKISEKKFSPLKRTRSEKEFELFECRVR